VAKKLNGLSDRTLKAPLNVEIKGGFNGYWTLADVISWKKVFTELSGFYFVFAARNAAQKGKVLRLRDKRLIYVGESQTVWKRLRGWNSQGVQLGHKKRSCFARHQKPGETIFFAAVPYLGRQRERAEAALIHILRPPCNLMYVKQFPFGTTSITWKVPLSIGHKNFSIPAAHDLSKLLARWRRHPTQAVKT